MSTPPPPPKVSVCIPVYNGEAHIAEMLESILKQTFQDFELLLVDNCSTDATLSIAQRILAGRPGVRIYRNDHNLGMVGNWNRCLELSMGEWIKFAFHDDVLEPHCLATMMKHTKWGIPFICCKRRIFCTEDLSRDHHLSHTFSQLKENWQIIDTLFPATVHLFQESIAEQICKRPDSNFLGEPNCTLFHRSVFEKYGGFPKEFSQLMDWEFMARVATNTGLVMIAEELALFRIHSKAATYTNLRGRDVGYADHFLFCHRLLFNPYYENFRALCTPEELKRVHFFMVEMANRMGAHLASCTTQPAWYPVVSQYISWKKNDV